MCVPDFWIEQRVRLGLFQIIRRCRGLLPISVVSLRRAAKIAVRRRHCDPADGEHDAANGALRANALLHAAADGCVGTAGKFLAELSPFIAERVGRERNDFGIARWQRDVEHA
jgi:hypothetical protein